MRSRSPVAILLAFSLMALGLAVPSQAPADAQETVTAIVELQRAPVGPAQARAAHHDAPFDAQAYQALIEAEQQAFLDQLEGLGISATVETIEVTINDAETLLVAASFTYAFNGIGIAVPIEAVSAIAALPGVKAVHPNRTVSALLDVSVDHINAPQAWGELGTRGEGQIVAVLDTGIDWTHPMFGGDPVTPPGPSHPKVKFYLTTTGGAVDGHGHGTHVSGIATGDRDFGDTLNGPALFNGVAPKADLWGYKVLSDAGSGSSLSIVLAIDDAAARGATVMNLSLGDSTGAPDSATASAVDGASEAGVAMAVAAGNDGPGYSTIGSPAAAHQAVTFGASTDPGDNEFFARLQVDLVESLQIIPLAGSPRPDTNQQARYADCGRALAVADCPVGTAGSIALIERGDTPFTAKAVNAEAAGAIAAIIYNNEPGNFAGTLILLEPSIPVVAMSQADGQRLLEFLDPVTRISTVELQLDWEHPNVISDQVAGFSSRGPNDDFVLKPDVVAPGNDVTSSVPPVASALSSPDRYAPAGGTSMASPHGAGALAILRASQPDWPVEWVKTALMNTAVQLIDPVDGQLYSIHDQGAGRIDLLAAATTPALVGETFPDGRLARGSVNFGEVRTHGGVVEVETTILVQDVSGLGRTWSLSFEPGDGKGRGGGEGQTLPADGFDLQIKPGSMKVGPGQARAVTVEITLDGRVLQAGDYEGRIVATGGGTTLRA
ncbi:MAG: S8 family serine peptidase, partial [Acidimicrobiia bacterium]